MIETNHRRRAGHLALTARAVCAGALLAFCGTSALAADVRGTLTGLDSAQPSAPLEVPAGRRAYYWEEPNGALDVRRVRANAEFDLTVVLTGSGVAEASQPVNVSVVGGRCRPGTAVVTANTVLRIQNNDWFAHDFFAVRQGQEGPVANFAAETTAPRSERQVQFAQPGVYEIRDRTSPTFRCFVLVGPGQGRVAPVAHDASYRFTNVADGEYVIKVYFEGRMLTETPVRVANNRELVVPAINLAPPTPPAGAAQTPPGAGAPGTDANQPAGHATRRRRGR